MLIRKLRLRNFKIFQKAEIPFNALTLLTGANSSGKSSIIHALTAVLQTRTPHVFPFEIDPSGMNCSLGSFRDIVYGKKTNNTFSIGIDIGADDNGASIDGTFRYSASGNQILPQSAALASKDEQFEVTWRGQERGYEARLHSDIISNMTAESLSAFQRAITRALRGTVKQTPAISLPEFTKYIQDQREQLGKWSQVKSRKPGEIIEELKGSAVGNMGIISLERWLQALDNSTSYIGPVRAYPTRYYLATETSTKVDPKGSNAIAILYDWKRHYPRRYEEVLRLLSQLKLATHVDAEASLEEILRLDVQPYRHREVVNLADVGFGISQVLPMLIADVALPDGGTLIVNQPEVHLHPSSQALLADYMAQRLGSRQYIVETHSEYLINRLRLLVKTEVLRPEDLDILYLDVGKSGRHKISPISIDIDGALLGAPKEFFETYFLDTFAIAIGNVTDDGEE